VHARDPVAYEAALQRLRPTVLRVVTMPSPLDEEPCDGTMTCSCQRCLRERAQRVHKGPLQGDRQQPWQPRPSRRRVA